MPVETIDGRAFAVGEVELFSIGPWDRRSLLKVPNLYLYQGADMAAKVVSGNRDYRIAAIYLEFENQVVPGPITPPVYDRSGGIDYYTSLAAPRDHLRIPLSIAPTFDTTDPALFDHNKVTYFAVTSATAGVHGLPFDVANNSAVFGGALAAMPNIEVRENDLIWARAYWAANPEYKQPNRQIGVQWTLRFL
jgi:hypothetical protein